MIRNCKFCNKEIPVPKYGINWWCSVCNHYELVCLDNGTVESEFVMVDNYYLIFFPAYKEANVVEKNDGYKIVNKFELNELTHELAVQWVKKLRTYVIFS